MNQRFSTITLNNLVLTHLHIPQFEFRFFLIIPNDFAFEFLTGTSENAIWHGISRRARDVFFSAAAIAMSSISKDANWTSKDSMESTLMTNKWCDWLLKKMLLAPILSISLKKFELEQLPALNYHGFLAQCQKPNGPRHQRIYTMSSVHREGSDKIRFAKIISSLEESSMYNIIVFTSARIRPILGLRNHNLKPSVRVGSVE